MATGKEGPKAKAKEKAEDGSTRGRPRPEREQERARERTTERTGMVERDDMRHTTTTTTTKKQHDPDILCHRCVERGHVKRTCNDAPNPSKVEKARAAMSLEESEVCGCINEASDDEEEVRPLSSVAAMTRGLSCCALDLQMDNGDVDTYVPASDVNDSEV